MKTMLVRLAEEYRGLKEIILLGSNDSDHEFDAKDVEDSMWRSHMRARSKAEKLAWFPPLEDSTGEGTGLSRRG